ncbi:MAG: hypothetical protein ABFC57_06310 [Veillonellales bacterium]
MAGTYSAESQAEKRLRGEQFQEEIRRSWSLIPNCWRMRITDDCGSRPADEIVILPYVNFLIEMKRKAVGRLCLSDLRMNQIGGLNDFEKTGEKNVSLIMFSCLNAEIDVTYAVTFKDLLWFMKKNNRLSLKLMGIRAIGFPLPRLLIGGKPGFDLSGLVAAFKERKAVR